MRRTFSEMRFVCRFFAFDIVIFRDREVRSIREGLGLSGLVCPNINLGLLVLMVF